MDKKLHILHHLYAEEQDPDALHRLLRDDEPLRQEHAALADVKRRLDRRPRHRPDAAVIDRVIAAAGRKREARMDRAPARPGRRLFGLVGAACTLLVLAVIGVQLLSTGGISTEVAEQEAVRLAERDVPSATQNEAAAPSAEALEREAVQDQAPPSEGRASERLASASSGRAAPPEEAPTSVQDEGAVEAPAAKRAAVRPVQPAPLVMASTEVGWDAADEVRRLHRRIELVQARSRGLAWDDPAIEASAMTLAERRLSDPLLRESLLDMPPAQPQFLHVDQPRLLQADGPQTLPRNR